MSNQPSRAPRRFLMISLAIIAIATIGAYGGALHWLGDLLALLVDYYIAAAAVLAVVFLRGRAWRWAGAAAAVALLAGIQLLSYPRVAPVETPAAERNLRLLVYNLYYLNNDLDGVVALVERYDPDVVFLMEYSEAVQQRIEPAFADYPYQLIRPSRFTMGLALFSRLPIEAAEVYRGEATRIPVYDVRLRAGERQFSFVGGHPWPPQPQWGDLHRRQMEEIARVAALAAPPLIVAGDFNAVPWSYTMRILAERSAARPVRRDLDLTKTWSPFVGFGLPIDHVLVSSEWQVMAKEYGPAGGSDHVPLILDLRLPQIADAATVAP